MRCNCSYKKIKSVCSFVGDGDWIESKDQSESGIRLIQTGNIGNGVFKDKEDKAKFISSDTFSELGCTEIFEGDCLISRLPDPIGRCCILPKLEERTITAVDCTILRFNEEIIPQYFVYYSQSRPYSIRIQSKTTGSTRKRISRKNLENIDIPIPSLEEQERIVSELDKINELIRLKREQLKDYDNLAQSIFYEMFGDPVENEKGWEVKKLINNVQEMFLGPFGSALKVDSYVEKKDAFCMVYEQKHAIQGRLDLDNHFINEEKFNSLKRFEVKGGDFIMSCRGTIGKLYKLPNDAPKGIIHPSLMKIRIKEDVYDSTYFKYMLVKIVANESTNGNCVQMAITAKELGKKTLPLPPLSLQQLFAQRIKLIEQQKAEIQNTIADLETLLASRMQYWFD